MVAKFLDLKQPFLTETTICIFERWKKSMSYHFSFFLSAIFAGPRFVKIQEFCYHGNMT